MRSHLISRKVLSALVIAALAASAAGAQAPARPSDVVQAEHRFRSAALGKDIAYIALAPSPDRGGGPFPVLYLLHGYGGDYTNWTTHTRVADLVHSANLIVITPEGENSWYVNGANGERWEDYVTIDLVADVEAHFRTVTTRAGRAIAGLSMGGYGAIGIGLAHPDRYALAMSTSGAFDITQADSVFSLRSSPDVLAVFGDPGSDVRRTNDVNERVAHADPDTAPYLYMACGTSDPWNAANHALDAAMTSRRLVHEFHERPGGHDWTFWDGEIPHFLETMRNRGFVK